MPKDTEPLSSWNVYLKTGPLVTYSSVDEEEALKRLAKMCDEWGLSPDSFVLEIVESDEALRWGIYIDGTLLPWTVTADYRDACVRAEEIRIGSTNVEVRRVQG